MGRQKTPGLRLRGRIWYISKRIKGYGRLSESTGTGERGLAEEFLQKRLVEIYGAVRLGRRPVYEWTDAVVKYLHEATHLRTYADQQRSLRRLDPYLRGRLLHQVHDDVLRPFVSDRLAESVKHSTINRDLEVVRRILRLASRTWRDGCTGVTWLSEAPAITMLRQDDAREPTVLEWNEQDRLMRELPTHLAKMVLFSVNTGCRQEEVCGLRWDESRPEHFLLSKQRTKTKRARRVPLNRVARRVIEDCRGDHGERVFVYRGNPVTKINNTAWKKARARARLSIRVHDLRHSFAVRLREAGVHAWTISALLGHQSKTITEHYAQPRMAELLEAVERLCERPEDAANATLKLRVGGAKFDITPQS